MIGTKLASYEITGRLGAGGMGEVYQATDSKLGRPVAIKILPEIFAHDNDRLARLEREARVLASLNHPNIATIYGLEEVTARKFLIMELVPGETLADRIQRGPIPLDEALGIAKQIAEALEAAHELGVVHRDLKPANVKITPDGKVKVLDFGLAKLAEQRAAKASLESSPTLMPDATQAGMILGTAAYMSPEQARGKDVDKRADIWAFGVVLYEMLTGQRLFHGETVSDTLAGKLVAYSSNGSGRWEIHVQTFPLSDQQWTISNGGYEPRWRADGREIYYLSEDRKLMAVTVKPGPSFEAPRELFQTRVPAGVDLYRMHYVPNRDGSRFLVNTQSGDPPQTPITVVLNWTQGLKKQ